MRASLTAFLLILIGVVSLVAQGVLFIPSFFEFILQYLPPWGNLTFGALIFIAAIFAYVAINHRV